MVLRSIFEFFVTHIWVTLSIIGLLFAINMFRNQLPWGAARYMGVTGSIFGWMVFIYWLVLFEGAYGVASVILDWPFLIDILLFLSILGVALFIYYKLLHRDKFKPQLFASLFLLPLSIPGIHMAGKLLPKVATPPISVINTTPNPKPTKSESPPPIVRDLLHVEVAGSDHVVNFANRQEKGRLGDALTASRLTAAGYKKLASKLNQLHGIDGVYVKYDAKGDPVEILIIENKVDGGTLAKEQMTDNWFTRKVESMIEHADEDVRRAGELIRDNPSLVRKELWHHDLRNGRTTISSLDGEAKKTVLRAEQFLGGEIRRRCKAQNPTLRCTPVPN